MEDNLMKKFNEIFGILILLIASVIMISFTYLDDPAPWEVTGKYKNMENPVEADAGSTKIGKMLYSKNCASCHGKTGLGDGAKARGLETSPGDFSGDYYQSQTDGEHFYKTKTGRDEMPKFDKKIADEDIWNMINYMRTFKK